MVALPTGFSTELRHKICCPVDLTLMLLATFLNTIAGSNASTPLQSLQQPTPWVPASALKLGWTNGHELHSFMQNLASGSAAHLIVLGGSEASGQVPPGARGPRTAVPPTRPFPHIPHRSALERPAL